MPEKIIDSINKEKERLFSDNYCRTSSANTDAIRERIALISSELYKYNPVETLCFLTRIARDTNPLVRINIIRALVYVAHPETFRILFNFYLENDCRIRGEILNSIAKFNHNINAKDKLVFKKYL